MNEERTLNLLGAMALSVVDSFSAAVEANAGHGGETPAALVTLGVEPGLSINQLRQILALSHPGTVRLIDRLEAQNLVERRAGADGKEVPGGGGTWRATWPHRRREKRKTILTERRNQLQIAVSALTSDERTLLTKLLEKMLTAMTTSELQAFTICRLCEEEVCPGDRCPVEQQYCALSDNNTVKW